MPIPTTIDDAAQRRLAAMHDRVTLDDCYIYHRFDVPSGETIVGSWDLRQNRQAYLGGVDYRGMRVLEAGPASGYLSLKMEAMGAEVVAFDLPPGNAARYPVAAGSGRRGGRRQCREGHR